MTNPITKKYIVITSWLSLAISILVHFSSLFDEFVTADFAQRSALRFTLNALMEITITYIISFLLFGINFYILKPLQPSNRSTWKRLLTALLVSFILVIFLSDFLFEIKSYLIQRDGRSRNEILFTFKDFFIAMVVIISISVIRIINQNQQNTLEIQNLKIENLQRQFDVLKSQVSPHFLFNSLNSLKILITESPEIAQKYLIHLSSILRYTLQANENKLVSLKEELQFIESYFFLIKLRFGGNITLVQNIGDKFLEYKIPPLALQILLENAIRHNEISKRNSLEISILTTENQTLVVSNPINKKITPEPGTGLGLANLSNQFRILGNKEIEIKKEDQKFIVEIPLLA